MPSKEFLEDQLMQARALLRQVVRAYDQKDDVSIKQVVELLRKYLRML